MFIFTLAFVQLMNVLYHILMLFNVLLLYIIVIIRIMYLVFKLDKYLQYVVYLLHILHINDISKLKFVAERWLVLVLSCCSFILQLFPFIDERLLLPVLLHFCTTSGRICRIESTAWMMLLNAILLLLVSNFHNEVLF